MHLGNYFISIQKEIPLSVLKGFYFFFFFIYVCAVLCLVNQSCLNLCDPMDCSPTGFSVHGDSPGKNIGVGCHVLLQRIFPTQGSNPSLPCRGQIIYCLSHQGSQKYWSGQLIPAPGDLPNPGIEPGSPALQEDSLPVELPGKPLYIHTYVYITCR